MKLLKTILLSAALLSLTACGDNEFYEGTYTHMNKPNVRFILTDSSIQLIKKNKIELDTNFNVIKAVAPLDKYAAGALDISFDIEGKEITWPLSFWNQDIIALQNETFIREGASFEEHLAKYYGKYSFSNEHEALIVTFDKEGLKIVAESAKRIKPRKKIIEYTLALPVEIENKKVIILKDENGGGVTGFEYGDGFIIYKKTKLTKM